MRYDALNEIKSPDNIRMLRNVKYPTIPLDSNDLYIYTNRVDRYDRLALKYYNNQDMWYIIALANPNQELNSLFIPSNLRIRIPARGLFYKDIIDSTFRVNIGLDYDVNITNKKKVGQSKITLY